MLSREEVVARKKKAMQNHSAGGAAVSSTKTMAVVKFSDMPRICYSNVGGSSQILRASVRCFLDFLFCCCFQYTSFYNPCQHHLLPQGACVFFFAYCHFRFAKTYDKLTIQPRETPSFHIHVSSFWCFLLKK